MTEEVVFAGFGGQGILLAGKMLAQAALASGYETTWFPSYGPEMRGGTANCTIIIADEEIGSPVASAYDTAIVMNQPSLEKFEALIRPGGRLVINASMVPTDPQRTDLDVRRIDALDIAKDLGNQKAANVVMLGAYIGCLGLPPIDALERILAETFAAKGDTVVQLNFAALKAGLQQVSAAVA